MSGVQMDVTFIKGRLCSLFTEAEKLEKDLARQQLDWALWRSEGDQNDPPEVLIDKDDELVKPFEYLALSLYLTTVCLLDALNSHVYINLFFQKFGEKFDAQKAASDIDIDHYWSGEPYNLFLSDLRQFLSPLDVLGNNSDRYLKLSGVQYLEAILKNTAVIIQNGGKIPNSETKVYTSVRKVLEVIFPSAKAPKSSFNKTAQNYKPDILIPELSAAIEYKYADGDPKLKATIAQIADDVKGYTGDREYNLFYAVFYVTNDFWGEDKFKLVWKEKNFPKNWRAFYIVGK